MFGLFGCGGEKYRLILDDEDAFTGVKESYRAGEKVEFCYSYRYIATDTDYTFYLDGEKFSPSYKDDRGFVFKFKMPSHDVTVKVESRNSMIATPRAEPGDILVDYYSATVGTDGYDCHTELVLTATEDADVLLLSRYEQEDPESDESCIEYLVPYDAYEVCYEVIGREGFEGWDKLKNPMAIEGASYVLKYRDEYGDYHRCTSAAMPEDGSKSFGTVGNALSAYLREEYLKK